jgi:hypothetical protein
MGGLPHAEHCTWHYDADPMAGGVHLINAADR